jgi:hypothetical protein
VCHHLGGRRFEHVKQDNGILHLAGKPFLVGLLDDRHA